MAAIKMLLMNKSKLSLFCLLFADKDRRRLLTETTFLTFLAPGFFVVVLISILFASLLISFFGSVGFRVADETVK